MSRVLDSPEHTATPLLLLRLIQRWQIAKALQDEKAALEARITDNAAQIADCEAGLRVLGHDVHKEGVWSQLTDTYGKAVQSLWEDEGNRAMLEQSSQGIGATIDGPRRAALPIHQLLLRRLQELTPGGASARELRDHLKSKYGIDTHPKTAGMSLYRLSKSGQVQRQGLTWFFVPPTTAEENTAIEQPAHNKPSK